MAVTDKQLKDLKFTPLKGTNNLVRPVGNDIIFTATKGHIYLNGSHLINTEFIDFKFLGQYIEKVIHAKRKTNNANNRKAEA